MTKNNCDVTIIVAQKPLKFQSPCGEGKQSPDVYGKQSEFWKFYRDRSLTDCLETLARWGVQGDSAIFTLTLMGGER